MHLNNAQIVLRLYQVIKGFHLRKEWLELIQRQCTGAITARLMRVRMGL